MLGTSMLIILSRNVGVCAFSAVPPVTDFMNYRYCEIIPIYTTDLPTELRGELFQTIGFNECPAEAWEQLTAESVMDELGEGVVTVRMNGPRYNLMNSIEATPGVSGVTPPEPLGSYTFGGILEMGYFTDVVISPDSLSASGVYFPTEVLRTTTFTWNAGRKLYQLHSDDGKVYVMHSYSQQQDDNLSIEQLDSLGERLNSLPPGWKYVVQQVDEAYKLVATGSAWVVNDDFVNTYELDPSLSTT